MELRIRVLSDIHLEHGSDKTINYQDEDFLVIAGDLCNNFNRTEGVEFIKNYLDSASTNVIVLYVLGNHEYYGGTIEEVENFWYTRNIDKLIVFGKTPKIFTYNKNEKKYHFIGCTLWTDLKHGQLIWKAVDFLNDFNFIEDFIKDSCFYLKIHETAVEELQSLLSKNKDGEVIIITHHPPFKNSVSQYYKDDDLNRLFYSELDFLLQSNIRYWIHGHVHNSCDYFFKKCQVVCNPFFQNERFNDYLILK